MPGVPGGHGTRPLAGGVLLGVVVLLAAVVAAGCGGDGEGDAAAGEDATAGSVRVFAAASLVDAFGELATAFTAAVPGARVEVHVAGSSALATQIEQAAPADVFASANGAQMDRLAAGGFLAEAPRVFAATRVVIVVPRDDPRGEPLTAAVDLARPGVRLVVALPDVPAGRYAVEALEALAAVPTDAGGGGAGFAERALANVVSEESDVRAVLAKVELGVADAGIVYRTDALASEHVRVVEFPAAARVQARYPLAPLAESDRPLLARAFVDFVLGAAGQAILARHGFEAP